MDQINVQIIFTFPAVDQFPEFRDALYIPYDQYLTLQPADIDAMKQERYDNWKQIILNPPVPIEEIIP